MKRTVSGDLITETKKNGDFCYSIDYKLSDESIIHNGSVYFKTKKVKEAWYLNNVLHNSSGPALLEYNDQGVEVIEGWFFNGLLHNDTGPAWIQRKSTPRKHGQYKIPHVINSKEWYLNGKLHNGLGPAIVSDDLIVYAIDGELHNPTGPAVIERSKDSITEKWYSYGQLHNSDSPAWISKSGDKIEKRWYCRGLLHLIGAPAIVTNDSESYYVYGVECPTASGS